ncbi:thioesterase II family protein [Streptomyces sp. TP-A0874]|uniref:thioesterase II family protein n=1 Tax=Streptomyces sp. TP-A0874 TaxID=549819 RepID=UPI0008539DE3|nr:alpha/beta fold hydrolase [Streptomyces sp. TP-A0874]
MTLRTHIAAERSARWFRCFRPRPQAAVLLYALPFAGGGAAFYRAWADRLPASVELRAVQLPGRQDRMAEPPAVDCAALCRSLASALRDDLSDRPFALFGHSMGALLSFELARELRRLGERAPVALGVSGWSSPRDRLPHGRYTTLSDAEFLTVVRRLGGMPQDVLDEPDLLSLVLPTLRADFQVVEGYSYREEPPLDLPMSVFGGVSDPFTERQGLEGWQQETTGPVTVRHYPGRHFYLTEHADAVAGAFLADLRAALAGSNPAPTEGGPR